jgi:hypothetical protein
MPAEIQLLLLACNAAEEPPVRRLGNTAEELAVEAMALIWTVQ